MIQSGLITHDTLRNITYDAIIDSCIATLQIKRNKDQLKRYCLKFISALDKVGGPVSAVPKIYIGRLE